MTKPSTIEEEIELAYSIIFNKSVPSLTHRKFIESTKTVYALSEKKDGIHLFMCKQLAYHCFMDGYGDFIIPDDALSRIKTYLKENL